MNTVEIPKVLHLFIPFFRPENIETYFQKKSI